LHSSLFDEDAIVLKNPGTGMLTLASQDSGHKVVMHLQGFPYLGIWSKKGCKAFICLEPWYGLADTESGHADISSKEGICRLEPGEVFECRFSMEFYS